MWEGGRESWKIEAGQRNAMRCGAYQGIAAKADQQVKGKSIESY